MKFSLKKFISSLFIFVLFFSLNCENSHNVQKGETLYSISKKYQLTVAELRAANNLSENDVLKAGQKLIIPEADISTAAVLSSLQKINNSQDKNEIKTSFYEIQKGDTLYAIAKKNNISVAQLLLINDFDSSVVIKIGQKIKIPQIQNNQEKSKDDDIEQKLPKFENKITQNSLKKENEEKIKITKDSQEENFNSVPDTRTYGQTIHSENVKWPVQNPIVTQTKGKVSGVQLSAKHNEKVICIHEGTVMYVGLYRGFGQVLFVQTKTGLIYAYTGLSSVNVKKSEYVISGAELGIVGIDSISQKPQLNFMVFQNGQPIDPAKAPRS